MNWHALTHIDRRWLFLAMAVALAVPLLFPLRLPYQTTKMLQDLYDGVEAIPEGSTVLVAADYDPGSAPELHPFAEGLFRHLFRKNLKVVVISLWPAAPPLVDGLLEKIAAKEFGKKYGTDYVNLGFMEGQLLVMKGISENLPKTYPKDSKGTPVGEIPMMSGLRDVKSFAALLNVSAGYPGIKEWVQLVQSRYNVRMAGAVTAVSALDYIPYYQSGQLFGLSAGMRGSAEYEKLVGFAGSATRGMDAQNLGHVLIILSIMLGNAIYFATKPRGKR